MTSVIDPRRTAPDPEAPDPLDIQGVHEGELDATPRSRFGDRVFFGMSWGAGALILVILMAVAAFLVAQSMPALVADPERLPGSPTSFWSYVLPFAFGTVWIAFLALLIATPLAIAIALFVSHYAPRPLAAIFGYVIDLLAAVPSVVFGLWGIQVLAPNLHPIYNWLNDKLGWISLFDGPVSGTGRTTLTVALVLAVMALPIMTAICREVFVQTPRLHEEAALALGATRWEMVRMAVLPYGRSGIISAMMLGLGRALGETMVVAMVLSPAAVISFALLTTRNPNSIASNIALNFPEAYGITANALVATGLILFVITLVVNMVARWFIGRRKEFSGANG